MKYDWKDIQQYYNNGYSWRDLRNCFGVSMRGLQKAVKRGDLVTTRSISEAGKLTYINGRVPSIPNETYCRNLSKIQSQHNRGGKCKWYCVDGVWVQGTWEKTIAEFLSERGIKWVRPSPFPYLRDGSLSNYTPDFHLIDFNLYLEVKGHWWGDDKNKMLDFTQQYPDLNIVLIDKEAYRQFIKYVR